MLAEYEPKMLNLILESNEQMKKEMEDPKVAEENKKVFKRVDEFENEQDKKVMC